MNVPYASYYAPLISLVSDQFVLFSFLVQRIWKMLIVRPPMRAQTAPTVFLFIKNKCFRSAVHYSLVTQYIFLPLWLQQHHNLKCLLGTSLIRRSWVISVNVRVSGFGHIGITNKNSQEMVSETFGVWFYLRANCSVHCLTSSTAPWMWLMCPATADWCGLLSSGPQLQTMHGGLLGFLRSRPQMPVKAHSETQSGAR